MDVEKTLKFAARHRLTKANRRNHEVSSSHLSSCSLTESLNSNSLCHPLYPITGVPHHVRRAVDTSPKIATKDLKEKKEVVEETENGRDVPANGNANEENREQEADSEVEEEEEEGDGEQENEDEDEEAEAATGKRAAKEDEDDNVDTKKQRTVVTFEQRVPPAHFGQAHPQMTRTHHHPTKTTT
ncbi:PREDICTED: prothymosin alpha-like [Chrysochloris asiatica]|uniref:Prothymosin alpha n=1 Tax=Chrysochloris asiatica TaxID=185453 RepID=A0A9B0TAG7_CHRAS|nr:PREDICTED: prothymosin alpha-like [Chrysochloris asiatica]